MQSISLSPSFTTTTTHSSSSATLADIAARVVNEFRLESDFDDDLFADLQNDDVAERQNPTIKDDENSDFEFPSVCRDPPQSISADEIFYNGQIRPVFPVFGRTDLLFGGGVGNGAEGKVNCSSKPRNRSSLRTLMREDRDPASCSSSESDDLDGVPAEIYCAWTPKSAAEVKKSGSTGSSKRWRIRDLLFRSNSDGRDSFVFLASSSNGKKKDDDDRDSKRETATEKSSFGGGEVVPVQEQEEDNYGKSGVAAAVVVKDGERRRLYGRQDWVGFFANVNGVNSNLRPF